MASLPLPCPRELRHHPCHVLSQRHGLLLFAAQRFLRLVQTLSLLLYICMYRYMYICIRVYMYINNEHKKQYIKKRQTLPIHIYIHVYIYIYAFQEIDKSAFNTSFSRSSRVSRSRSSPTNTSSVRFSSVSSCISACTCHIRRRIHVSVRLQLSYEEEDTCVSASGVSQPSGARY